MRILVTGSRNWSDHERVWDSLDSFASILASVFPERFVKEGFVLVSGHCRTGVDRMAEQWYADRFPLETPELWPADWKKHGNRAGFLRNVAMVDSGPDLCVAYIAPCDKKDCAKPRPHGSHGASQCADYAQASLVQTSRYYEGGLDVPRTV